MGPNGKLARLDDADARKGLVVDLHELMLMTCAIEMRQPWDAHVAYEAVEGLLEGLGLLSQLPQQPLLSF